MDVHCNIWRLLRVVFLGKNFREGQTNVSRNRGGGGGGIGWN